MIVWIRRRGGQEGRRGNSKEREREREKRERGREIKRKREKRQNNIEVPICTAIVKNDTKIMQRSGKVLRT